MKIVIFDFDGTIADSFDTVLDISNRLAVEFGYLPTDRKDVQHLKDLSSREILQKSGVPFFKLPFLLRRLRAEMQREVRQLKPIPGIKDALLELKSHGNQLGIVTSNSRENVLAFLASHDMAALFEFVDSGLTLFGKGKVIQRVLKSHHLDPATVVYVGDETRDIEAARTIRIPAIAVSWGFNSGKVLAAQYPTFLVNTPAELVTVITRMP